MGRPGAPTCVWGAGKAVESFVERRSPHAGCARRPHPCPAHAPPTLTRGAPPRPPPKRSLRFLYTCVDAALSLHNQLLSHLLRLPKAFFDTNPAGRILNRFSRDTEVMDTVLSQSMVQFCNCFMTYLAILIVISVATKWFAIAIVPITVVYVLVQARAKSGGGVLRQGVGEGARVVWGWSWIGGEEAMGAGWARALLATQRRPRRSYAPLPSTPSNHSPSTPPH